MLQAWPWEQAPHSVFTVSGGCVVVWDLCGGVRRESERQDSVWWWWRQHGHSARVEEWSGGGGGNGVEGVNDFWEGRVGSGKGGTDAEGMRTPIYGLQQTHRPQRSGSRPEQ